MLIYLEKFKLVSFPQVSLSAVNGKLKSFPIGLSGLAPFYVLAMTLHSKNFLEGFLS